MELFCRNELYSRVVRFQKYLESENIDIALFSLNSDLFYFTGSIQRGLLIIPKKSKPVYFVRKDYRRALEESPLDVEIFDYEKIKELTKGIASAGIPMDVTTLSDLNFLKNKILPTEIAIKDVSYTLALTKMIKSESEISLIKKAATINTRIMEHAKSCYHDGMKDSEMQIEVESFARTSLGHQGMYWTRGSNMDAALSLVVTGISSLKATYTDFPIGGVGLSPSIAQGASGDIIGDSFVIDFVGCIHGYVADSTRTFFTKPPSQKIIQIYSELVDINRAIVSFISPGVSAQETYNFTIAAIEDCDWKDWFMGLNQKAKFVGHGVGVEINQLPVIAEKQDIMFENSMVIAIEPKIFVPDYGIVGIEDTYLLEDDKLISLTGDPSNIYDFVIDN